LDFDGRIGLPVFDRVCDQAAQHLLEALKISPDYRQGRTQADAGSRF
jgi:hypothetical protein